MQDLTPGTAELFPAGLTPLCSFTVLPCPLVGLVELCERTSTEELLLPPPPQQTGVHAALVLTALCLAEVKQSKLLWQGNTVLSGGTQVQPTLEDLGSVDTSCFASSEGRGSGAPSDHLDLSSNKQKPLFYHKGKKKRRFPGKGQTSLGLQGLLVGISDCNGKACPTRALGLGSINVASGSCKPPPGHEPFHSVLQHQSLIPSFAAALLWV